jgi:hypothetical protein
MWVCINGELTSFPCASERAVLPFSTHARGLVHVVAWSSVPQELSIVLDDDLILRSAQSECCVAVCIDPGYHRLVVDTVSRKFSDDEIVALDDFMHLLTCDFDDHDRIGALATQMLAGPNLERTVPLLLFSGALVALFNDQEEDKMASKKKLSPPDPPRRLRMVRRLTCGELVKRVEHGQHWWRVPSTTFSTMMRFLQKEKRDFHWKTIDSITLIAAY